MIRGMPDDYGKITREEFLQMTGQEPQRPKSLSEQLREDRILEKAREEMLRLAEARKGS